MSILTEPCPNDGTIIFHRLTDGTTVRLGQWLQPGSTAPGILVLPGRTEFIEKYFEVVRELKERGFSVICLDWPNQGLSDRPLPDRYKHYVQDFADLAATLAQVVERIAIPAMGTKISLLAHSMGGHCALRYLGDYPDAFGAIHKVVLNAPMIDINFGGLPRWLVRALISAMIAMGRGKAYALGQNAQPTKAQQRRFEALLSSDPVRVAQERALIEANPDLHLGGVTWAFLDAAWRSSRLLESEGYAEAIKTPTLIFRCGRDKVIDNGAIDAFAARLPAGTLHRVDDARHELLRERDELRAQYWAAFDAFMAQD